MYVHCPGQYLSINVIPIQGRRVREGEGRCEAIPGFGECPWFYCTFGGTSNCRCLNGSQAGHSQNISKPYIEEC